MAIRALRRTAPVTLAVVLAAGLLALIEPAAAAPPGNDDFGNAAVIAGAAGSVGGTTVDVWHEAGEPNAFGCRTIWYRWTAPDTGHTRFEVVTPTVDDDVLVDLFTGTQLQNLEQQRRVGFESGSVTVDLPTMAGTEYRIRITSRDDQPIPVTLSWLATTPPNDDYGSPLSVGDGSGVARSSNVSATEEPSEPDHAGMSTSTSVWFTFFATRTASLTLHTRGSSFGTVLAAHDLIGPLGALNELASNDDAAGGAQSEITVNVTAGSAINVVVDGFNGATGVVELHWSYPRPGNDAFAASTSLTGASGNGSGTTAGASAEVGEPNHAGVSGLNGTFASVWYDWTAPSSGAATFRTKDPRETNTTLAAYQGTAVNALFELAANDSARDYQSGEDAEITFLAKAGETYRIAVADEAYPTEFGTPGDFSFEWAATRRGAVYCWYMASTTVKLSVETRDRIRALGGDTYEDTIIEALDKLEADRFWTQAEAAVSWRESLTDDERAVLVAREAEIDAAFDGIE